MTRPLASRGASAMSLMIVLYGSEGLSAPVNRPSSNSNRGLAENGWRDRISNLVTVASAPLLQVSSAAANKKPLRIIFSSYRKETENNRRHSHHQRRGIQEWKCEALM